MFSVMKQKNILKPPTLLLGVFLMTLVACSQSSDEQNAAVESTTPAVTEVQGMVSESLVSNSAASNKVSRPGEYQGYSEEKYDDYKLTSEYVEMRDGVKVAVDVFRPTINGEYASEKLPVLWMHTPYHRRNYRDGLTGENYPGKALKLAKYGYIVATADFRGLFASYGKNVAYNRGEWMDSARMDSYDITEWLAAQEWSSGKVGMWGCSATGGSQMQALSVAPPSLKAVFPMSCEWDVYPFSSFGGMSPPEGVPTRVMRGGTREDRDEMSVAVDGDDGSLLSAAIAEHENNIETAGYTPFRDSVSENIPEQWWLKSSPYMYKNTIEKSGIAIYSAMNLDEEGPGYGPAFTFNNVSNPRKFIVGPATHCDWTSVEKDTGFDILVEELRFFDHWLKGVANNVMDENAVTYYTYNLEENNGWRTAKSWPLPDQKLMAFTLAENSLQLPGVSEARGEEKATVTVDYDITNDNFWDKGLQFTTEALQEDMHISGHPVLKLWLSSSAADADVVARIDDIAPDGTATYRTVEGRLRASMRKQTEAPYNNIGLPYHPYTKDSAQPLTPGEAVEMEFDFYVISNLFKKGHKIRLTVNFADQRRTAKLDPQPEVTVYHGAGKESVLTLPIIQ